MPTSPTTAPWVRTGALPFLGRARRMVRDPLPLFFADEGSWAGPFDYHQRHVILESLFAGPFRERINRAGN